MKRTIRALLYCILILIVNFFSALGAMQGQSKVDFLLKQLTLPLPDSTRCHLLYVVAYQYRDINPDSGLYYANKLMQLARKNNNSLFIAAAYCSRGTNYVRKTNFTQAMSNLLSSIKILDNTTSYNYIADAYHALSIAQYLQADNKNALIASLKALQIRIQLKDSSMIAMNLNTTGLIYRALDDFNKSDSCYAIAMRLSRKINDKANLAKVMINIAINRSLQKPNPDYLKALSLQQQALMLNLEIQNNYGVENNYGGIGWLYTRIYLLKNRQLLPDNLQNAADNFNKGKYYLNKSIEIGRKIGDLNSIQANYFDLAQFLELANRPWEALAAYKHYREISDSIINKEKVNAITDLQIQYETEKKEQQIKLLAKVGIAKTALANEESQKKNVAYAGITGLILFGGITFSLYNKRKKLSTQLTKSLKELKAAQSQLIQIEKEKEAEKIRVRISRDMHDEIGSNLTKISLLSSISARINHNGSKELTEHLKQIQEYSHEVNSSLSEIVWAVSPKQDTLESLLLYMQKYIHDFFENTGVNYHIKFPATFENSILNPELKRTIFLVQKESLNNILKYARAKNVFIDFKITQNNFELKIIDDGVGFDMKNIANGNGLTNMKDRMQNAGGNFTIKSTPDNGTEMVASGQLN